MKLKNYCRIEHPFLFIDSCEIISEGIEGVGHRIFLPDEYFFKGHFPGMPIVPGVVLIEALAQTAGTVVSYNLSKDSQKSVLFMSIANAKFRKPVHPNDKIDFKVKKINQVKSVYKFYGEALKESDKVCESIFSAMIIDNK